MAHEAASILKEKGVRESFAIGRHVGPPGVKNFRTISGGHFDRGTIGERDARGFHVTAEGVCDESNAAVGEALQIAPIRRVVAQPGADHHAVAQNTSGGVKHRIGAEPENSLVDAAASRKPLCVHGIGDPMLGVFDEVVEVGSVLEIDRNGPIIGGGAFHGRCGRVPSVEIADE